MNTVKPLSWTSTLGYGLGDMANNFAFSMGLLFLLNYYTDVAGIAPAAAGTMLVVVRIYDAVMDVVAGRVVDRTMTRWGRFRPFLLWGALPLMLLSVAVFSVPAGLGETGKLVYAYVTYALLGTAYSFVNIPYGSLATAMTQVPAERARLGAARTLMGALTISFLAFVLGPTLRTVQGPALQTLLTQFTLMLAVLGVVLYFVCFRTSREVVERAIERPDWQASLRTLRANRPLQIVCLAALFLLVGIFSMNTSLIYYARYVLGDPGLFATIILVTSLSGTLISAPLVPALVRRLGKRGTFLLGMALASLAYLALFVSASADKVWVLGTLVVGSVGVMTAMIVLWAIEADTVEYGEWRTSLRIEGLSYSVFSFSRKCGQALGGSVPAFLLAASTYMPNVADQSPAALLAIRQGVALVPALAFGSAFLAMLFYPLTDRHFLDMLREIRERRSA